VRYMVLQKQSAHDIQAEINKECSRRLGTVLAHGSAVRLGPELRGRPAKYGHCTTIVSDHRRDGRQPAPAGEAICHAVETRRIIVDRHIGPRGVVVLNPGELPFPANVEIDHLAARDLVQGPLRSTEGADIASHPCCIVDLCLGFDHYGPEVPGRTRRPPQSGAASDHGATARRRRRSTPRSGRRPAACRRSRRSSSGGCWRRPGKAKSRPSAHGGPNER